MTRTALLLLVALPLAARDVAITIDDLPLGGAAPRPCDPAWFEKFTRKLLTPFENGKVPVIGFVNSSKCAPEVLRPILDLWLEMGADLGNHTNTHPDLNSVPLDRYQEDVIAGEPAIKAALAARKRELRWFRHPFLHAGPTSAIRQEFERFLDGRGYRIAPVTLDNSDYMFASVYAGALERGDSALAGRVRDAYLPYMESIFEFFERRSVEVAGHEIAQVLLIHANQLNADTMPSLLAMMRRRGYNFVTIERALQDPAYRLPDRYFGPGGFSWIHRWSQTKGMPGKGEPDEPAWIAAEYKRELQRP
jgi:peptidoglycan/xylan/chitin deacetylase (PgdA/CDA1 family)